MSASQPDGARGWRGGRARNDESLRRPRWVHLTIQNVGLELAIFLLFACIVAYCAVFYAQQQRFPGGFRAYLHRQQHHAAGSRRHGPDVGGGHPRHRPVGRRDHGYQQRDRRRDAGQHTGDDDFLVGDRAADRRRLRAGERIAGWYRPSSANPGNTRNIVHLPGHCDPHPAAAGGPGAGQRTRPC